MFLGLDCPRTSFLTASAWDCSLNKDPLVYDFLMSDEAVRLSKVTERTETFLSDGKLVQLVS